MTIKSYGSKDLKRDYGPLTFGNAIESQRLCDEKTLKEFAKSLGISAQSLCDIEKGRRIPSPSRAMKIAKKLKEPPTFWIQLAFQDLLRKEKIDLVVSVRRPD